MKETKICLKLNSVKESFELTKDVITNHIGYPENPGIYCFFINNESELDGFGKSKILYIGIAKYSIADRDFNQHFNDKNTGRSTLRRSLGAILKNELDLTAIPRGGINDSKRFINYKFENNENRLTDWMINNLKIGYYIPSSELTYKELRDLEKDITIELRPVLDLDNRTRKYNVYAKKLNALREICVEESKENEKGSR